MHVVIRSFIKISGYVRLYWPPGPPQAAAGRLLIGTSGQKLGALELLDGESIMSLKLSIPMRRLHR